MGGPLEVVCGCMFSGKTEELARRVKRATYAKQIINIFVPPGQQRAERSLAELTGISVHPLIHTLDEEVDAGVDLIVIDEAQFFPLESKIILEILQATKFDISVVVAGLDLDFAERPFGLMPQFLAVADRVTKLTAVCMKCHKGVATRTQRLTKDTTQVVVGDRDAYEARCRACYIHDSGM